MDNKEQNQIPRDILEAIETSKVYDALEKLGEKHNLLLDQVGQLEVDTRLMLLGEIKSANFVDTIAKDLEISKGKAEAITADINTEIVTPLRDSLRKMQEEAEKREVEEPIVRPAHIAAQINPIEKVGNFTIHQPTPSHSPQYNDSNLKREDVLHDLENIEKLKPENASNFVEHLLSNPSSRPAEQQEVKKAVPPTEQKKYTTDPYREQF